MHESDLCPHGRNLHPLRGSGREESLVPGSYYPPEARIAVGVIVKDILPPIFSQTLTNLFRSLAPSEELAYEELVVLHMPHLIPHVFKIAPWTENQSNHKQLIDLTGELEVASARISTRGFSQADHDLFDNIHLPWWPIIIEGGILPHTLSDVLAHTLLKIDDLTNPPAVNGGDSIAAHIADIHEDTFIRTRPYTGNLSVYIRCLGAYPTKTFLLASALNRALQNLQGLQSPIIGLLDSNNSLKSHSQLIAEFDQLLSNIPN